MATSSINKYLGSGDTLARLQAHAGRLLRLQVRLEALLPDYLAGACRVANLKDDELIIHADGAGVVVKLRQAVPSLLADFARAGIPLRDIKVKVAMQAFRPPPVEVPHRSVSDATRSGLGDLASQLPADSPLAKALQRFVRSAG